MAKPQRLEGGYSRGLVQPSNKRQPKKMPNWLAAVAIVVQDLCSKGIAQSVAIATAESYSYNQVRKLAKGIKESQKPEPKPSMFPFS